jgi:hypothetical protein
VTTVCLEVRLWLFFIWKYIKIIFFLFFKNYFLYYRIKIIWKY